MKVDRNLYCLALILLIPCLASGQSPTLQDIGGRASDITLPEITIYTAKEIITLDTAKPMAQAVAVVGDRILATGTLAELKTAAGDQKYSIDNTFADKIIVPGFVAQHDHPVLTALTMASEVLSSEDWVLPFGTIPAVKDKDDFFKRLIAAEKRLKDPVEPLVTWGYHPSFFGKLTRAELDKISTKRPIVVWARSCHEFILNTAALKTGDVTKELIAGWSPSAREQSNLDEGHFWEQGMFAVLATRIATLIATKQKLESGLELARDYMHAKGITIGNEPGGILVKSIQDGVNQVFSQPSMPFRWTFMVDGKTMADKYKDDAQVIEESERLRGRFKTQSHRGHGGEPSCVLKDSSHDFLSNLCVSVSLCFQCSPPARMIAPQIAIPQNDSIPTQPPPIARAIFHTPVTP